MAQEKPKVKVYRDSHKKKLCVKNGKGVIIIRHSNEYEIVNYLKTELKDNFDIIGGNLEIAVKNLLKE